ncbi:MAG: tetratricopeptide repeat protein [Taibaiella sp.]|nr:tetratricopeptide repeat protein [Taibaiella sp.]
MKWLNYKLLIFLIGCVWVASCRQGQNATDKNPVFNQPAVKEITEKINDHPKNAELYYSRGNMLHKLNEDSLALIDYKKAVHIDSSKAEYFSAIGNILFDHRDVTGSVEWLQKAILLNPQDRTAHLKIAKMFLFVADYPKAISEINIVLRQDVYNPEGYFLKGIVYRELKDTAKAISSLQAALNAEPKYKDAAMALGQIYSAKRDPTALTYFDNTFKIDTTDVLPLYAKGMYYQDAGKYEEAKAEYKNCIMHNTQYGNAYFNIGWILLQQDSLEKAWRQYDLVTKIQPNNAGAYYNRGLCNELMHKPQEALNDYKQALVFDDKYKDAIDAVHRLKK